MLPDQQNAQRTQIIALVVLLLAGGGIYYWQFGPAASGAAASNTAVEKAVVGVSAAALPKHIDLGKLEPVPTATESTRNPFKFGEPPRPPAPPPRPAPPGPTPSELAAERQRQAVLAGPPQKPPIPLKFIGYQVEPSGTVVNLSDSKGSVFVGRTGDVIDGQYRIVKIGLDSVTMEYLDGTGQRVIRFSGA